MVSCNVDDNGDSGVGGGGGGIVGGYVSSSGEVVMINYHRIKSVTFFSAPNNHILNEKKRTRNFQTTPKILVTMYKNEQK